MSKRKFLPESEIQRLERMTEEELEQELAAAGKRLELVRGLLVSYRLAARVANRAFTQVEEPSPVHAEALAEALSDYAPAYFGEHPLREEETARLIGLYELGDSAASGDELREAIYALVTIREPPERINKK